jgi:hypothetical protein
MIVKPFDGGRSYVIIAIAEVVICDVSLPIAISLHGYLRCRGVAKLTMAEERKSCARLRPEPSVLSGRIDRGEKSTKKRYEDY